MILMSVELQDNEKDIFEKVYYKYRNALYNKAYYILKNENDAEDVLQNAFIKIAKNIKGINNIEDKETAAYLLIITKSCAYDFLRKKNKERSISLEEIDEVSQYDSAIEQLAQKAEYENLVNIIRNIPSPYNEVLFLHYVKDFSLRKTAELLSRKQNTVKMQLVRGKKLLLKVLTEVYYE